MSASDRHPALRNMPESLQHPLDLPGTTESLKDGQAQGQQQRGQPSSSRYRHSSEYPDLPRPLACVVSIEMPLKGWNRRQITYSGLVGNLAYDERKDLRRC